MVVETQDKLSETDVGEFPTSYEDDYVKVENGFIIIKLFYFPIGNRKVKISEVKKIKYRRQTESYAKNWGSSSFTWWACDMKRNFRSNDNTFHNVSINNGEFFSKGFTVTDVVAFLRSLRNDLKGCEIGTLDPLA